MQYAYVPLNYRLMPMVNGNVRAFVAKCTCDNWFASTNVTDGSGLYKDICCDWCWGLSGHMTHDEAFYPVV